MTGGWFDPEALESEREEADQQQAELEAAGHAADRAHRRYLAHRAAGDFWKAAAACHHGAGYPLDSIAARRENDPRAGERGHRCTNCGSVLDRAPWQSPNVVHPCELPGLEGGRAHIGLPPFPSIPRTDGPARCEYCGASVHGQCSRPDCTERRRASR